MNEQIVRKLLADFMLNNSDVIQSYADQLTADRQWFAPIWMIVAGIALSIAVVFGIKSYLESQSIDRENYITVTIISSIAFIFFTVIVLFCKYDPWTTSEAIRNILH